ncbi:MAG: alpha/beta fold hydrolase [Gammaproteobacteria bacterium]
MTQKLIIYLILIHILFNFRLAQSSDLAKEKRWADQISDSIMTGNATWLKAGKQRFLGIFTPAQTEKTRGGIILVHGIGVHPNWPDVIQPLRTELPDSGWATLSIQMPILNNDATLKDYLPLFKEVPARFEAAIQFLRSNKIDNIVIISHSFGGTMASYYLTQKPDNPIKAFVGIGMSSHNFDDKLNVVKVLGKLKIPILDLYGSRDLELVIKSAPARAKAALKAANKNYSQVEVVGADHFFARMDDSLVSKVKSWLNKNALKSANTEKGK